MRLAAALALLLASTLSAWGATPGDKPIAMRGADTITLGQARAYVAGLDPDARAKLAREPAALTPLLRDLLLRRAILAEAAQRRWADRPEVAAQLARAREQVLADTFLAAQAAPPSGYPSEADIRAAYEQNHARLLLPRQYHLAQVFVPALGDAAAGARARLAALKAAGAAALPAGAKQAGLAYADLGWVAEPALIPAVRQAVAGLPEGQMTDPICVAAGCSLVVLVATKPAGPASLTEAHDTLARALRQQKQQANARAYEDTLLARAPIRVNELEFPAVFSVMGSDK